MTFPNFSLVFPLIYQTQYVTIQIAPKSNFPLDFPVSINDASFFSVTESSLSTLAFDPKVPDYSSLQILEILPKPV